MSTTEQIYTLCRKGFASFPLREDVPQHRVHQICLALERQGRIVRYIDSPTLIVWCVPTEDQPC